MPIKTKKRMPTRLAGFSLLFILVLVFLCTLWVESNTPPFIRLHILANSDREEDQQLKYRVRDMIISTMREEFREAQSIEESRTILLNKLNELEKRAAEFVGKEGYAYPVKAVYGNYHFPVKSYGSLTLPAGNYEAVRIIIGEGKGANWWCILFPPLCVVSGGQNVQLQEELASQIKREEVQGKLVRIKPALKIAELWNNI